MVAGIVTGAGAGGPVGSIGVMTLLAAGMMGANWAGRLGGSPAATLATEGVGEGAKMLQNNGRKG